MFRLRLQTRQPKITNGFTSEMITQTHAIAEIQKWLRFCFFTNFLTPGPKEKRRILPKSRPPLAETRGGHQRWPELHATPLLFQNFWIRIRFRIRFRQFFKFENPTPVQTPATIDPTPNLPMFLLKKWPKRLPATAEKWLGILVHFFTNFDFESHWCMRRRCRGCNHTPKSFHLVKIREKSHRIREKFSKIREKALRTFLNSLKI